MHGRNLRPHYIQITMAKSKSKILQIAADENIIRKIYNIRGQKVMLDRDLAELYNVETKRLKEAVRRNIERFPEDFIFELTIEEANASRTQFASLKRGGNVKYLPFAFTEQGVSMLSGVINSAKAIAMNIAIMRAFVEIRKIIINNNSIANKLQLLSERIDGHDAQLNSIYEAIENLLDDKIDKELEKENWLNRKRIGFKSDE